MTDVIPLPSVVQEIEEEEDIELALQKRSAINDSNAKSLLKFQKNIEFEGTKADLVCVDYSNKLFVSISSTGKFGVVISVTTASNLNQPNEIIYCVKSLFGQEEPLLLVFARSLAEKLRVKCAVTKPLLVSIGLSKEQLSQVNLLKEFEKTIEQALQQ